MNIFCHPTVGDADSASTIPHGERVEVGSIGCRCRPLWPVVPRRPRVAPSRRPLRPRHLLPRSRPAVLALPASLAEGIGAVLLRTVPTTRSGGAPDSVDELWRRRTPEPTARSAPRSVFCPSPTVAGRRVLPWEDRDGCPPASLPRLPACWLRRSASAATAVSTGDAEPRMVEAEPDDDAPVTPSIGCEARSSPSSPARWDSSVDAASCCACNEER